MYLAQWKNASFVLPLEFPVKSILYLRKYLEKSFIVTGETLPAIG